MSTIFTKDFVQSLTKYLPWWLSERVADALLVGFNYIAIPVSYFNFAYEWTLQGIQSWYPGKGTPTALPLIGRNRGMIRGMSESDGNYGARLRTWLDRWRISGSAEGIALGLHEWMSGSPVVKVVNRAGRMVTCDANGVLTVQQITWDWDSISNPERSNGVPTGANTSGAIFWSEIWIIVYTPPWTQFGGWPGGPSPLGALNMPQADHDALRGLLETGPSQTSAHSFVRAIILTYDPTLFDPSDSSKMPNGKFGQWSYPTKTDAARHISDRYTSPFSACRYLEPERNPQPTYPQ